MKRPIEAIALVAVVLLGNCAHDSGPAAMPSHVPGLDPAQAFRISSLPVPVDGASFLAEGSGKWGYYLIHVDASGTVVFQEGRTGDFFPRFGAKPNLNPYPALHWPPEAWQPTTSYAFKTSIPAPAATKLVDDVNASKGMKDLGVDCDHDCPLCVHTLAGAGGQTQGVPPLIILLYRDHRSSPIGCAGKAAPIVSDVDDLLRKLNIALPTPVPTGR